MVAETDKSFLFDQTLLQNLDFTRSNITIKHNLSAADPGEGLIMRPLHKDDYHNGYMDLLSQLTAVGKTTNEMFGARFNTMASCRNTYYVVVIEDVAVGNIVGSGTLVKDEYLNSKLELVSRGRVEDIVVASSHRGRNLGHLLLETIVLLAKYLECNETSLECKDHLLKFYHRFGFIPQDEVRYMTYRYEH